MTNLTNSDTQASEKAGVLYIVATPIGNIEDISHRAVRILKEVNLIAAEDTRHSQRLLQHYSINTPMLSVHDHNEQARIAQIAQRLNQGENIALISDAGTPLISDPGFKLVRGLRQLGYKVSPIPGASALIAAMSAAGLPSDSFSFWGFLPSKSGNRVQKFESLVENRETLIFYESSHRIEASLKDAQKVFGKRNAVVAREISKTFETFLADSLENLYEKVKKDSNQRKGEFVVMIEGSKQETHSDTLKSEHLLLELLKELPPNKASKIVANLTGVKKQDAYQQALALKNRNELN